MMLGFLEEARALLAGELETKNVRVVLEYPAGQMDGPLNHPVVSVGVAEVEIADAGTGRLAQAQAGPCRAEINLRLALHSPPNAGGVGLYGVLSVLLDSVLFASGWDVRAVRFGDITADRTTGSLRVQVTVRLRMLLKKEDI